MRKYFWSFVGVLMVITAIYSVYMGKMWYVKEKVLVLEAAKLPKKEYLVCEGKNKKVDGESCTWCEVESREDALMCFLGLEKTK